MPPGPPRARRWSLAALAVAAVAWAAWRATAGPQVPTCRVERRDLVSRVVASGQVMPPARVTLGSLWVGQVSEVLVDEGDTVRRGAVLLRLDDAEPRAAVRQARAAVAQAVARLDQVRSVTARQAAEGVRQAELRVEQADARLRRLEQLEQGGATTAQDLDDARKARDIARSALDAAVAQARSSAAGSELRLALAALEQARGQLAQAETRLAQAELTAPAAALVLVRAVEPGDVVQPGKALLVLSRLGDTRLTVEPDEKNLALLRVGQPASAIADAFPGQPFAAEVSFLAPSVDATRGTVEVRLRVPDPPPFLRPDMTVSVNVEVGRRRAVLAVPATAVRDEEGGPVVLRVRAGRVERRPVALGIRGEGQVEVVDGLAEGDEVVVPSAGPVAPGQRVRTRPASTVELAHAL